MWNLEICGEPYAGKLHVRFDEGAGVPDNKGRPALLYTLLGPRLQSVHEIIESVVMKIDKFHKCKKLICLLLCFQVLCCFGVLVALKFELDFQTICLLPKVLGMLVMLIGAICTVLLILLFWHSRCPNCGKPLFTRLIEYKRMRQMEKEEKMECPHCKSQIAINETDEGQVRRAKLG